MEPLSINATPNLVATREEGSSRRVGSSLLARVDQTYQQTIMVRNLVNNIRTEPMRIGTSLLTMLSGFDSLYRGDIATGVLTASVGAKEFYNLSTTAPGSTLERALSDLSADVGMLQSIEEAQLQSYSFIEQCLGQISLSNQMLQSRLEQVERINTEGVEEIERDVNSARAALTMASSKYSSALSDFNEAKTLFERSKEHYDSCKLFFERIKALAEDTSREQPLSERLEALVNVSTLALEVCQNGKKDLDRAGDKFDAALVNFNSASSLKDSAIGLFFQTAQKAQERYQSGIQLAQVKHTSEEVISQAQSELEMVKRRCDVTLTLLDEMADEVRTAKVEAGKKLDPSDLVMGVITGIGASSALALGPVAAGVAGVAAAYAWHNGTTISDTLRRASNYLSNVPIAPQRPMVLESYVRINFDEQSSGYYNGLVRGRQSYTTGHVDINLGNGNVIQYRFDLNQSKYPISKEDLFDLYRILVSNLRNGKITGERCKEILEHLKNDDIPRNGMPTVQGFIKKETAAYNLVKHFFEDSQINNNTPTIQN
jgi:hypothetical protein